MWLCKCMWFRVHSLHGCKNQCSVGWNEWILTDSQVIVESVHWLRWRCRDVVYPFDLLLPHPLSVLVAIIDPFRQSDLIEREPFFLLNGQRIRQMMVRWFLNIGERCWLASVCGKTTLTACSLVTVMGTRGGIGLCGITIGTYCTCCTQEWDHSDFTVVHGVTITPIIVTNVLSSWNSAPLN